MPAFRNLGIWAGLSLFGVVWLGPASTVQGRGRATPWAKVKGPSASEPASMGGYSHGCVAGAQALELVGDNHVVMRPARKRNYGHPQLVAFVLGLAKSMKEHGMGRLAVGDLGQARGGPAPSGHKSHQSGLDVDLWYLAPPQILRGKIPKTSALAKISAVDLVKPDQSGVTAQMDQQVASVLRRTASDHRVARVFVNPRIKQALCKREVRSRAWLRKIRPWWGHSAHFHVRLTCPASDTLCENQAPLPAGDGCGDLWWWFDKKAQEDRKKGRADYRKNMGKAPTMPEACQTVLHAAAKK